MGSLEVVFMSLYKSICAWALPICAIKMASDIIKNFNSHSLDANLSTITNGVVSYGCLCSVTTILNTVKDHFQ